MRSEKYFQQNFKHWFKSLEIQIFEVKNFFLFLKILVFRFQSEARERAKQKRIVPLSLQLGASFEGPRTFDPSKAKIIGTSTQMFKPFLRLTTAPEPWEVRTKQQLPLSFKAVLEKWKEEHNYKWTCEQLKVKFCRFCSQKQLKILIILC